jgi:hypothetical protein
MAYFQTKNPDLGKFWSLFQFKMLYIICPAIWYLFLDIWYISWLFGPFSPVFGMLYQAKIWQPCLVHFFTVLANFYARNVDPRSSIVFSFFSGKKSFACLADRSGEAQFADTKNGRRRLILKYHLIHFINYKFYLYAF